MTSRMQLQHPPYGMLSMLLGGRIQVSKAISSTAVSTTRICSHGGMYASDGGWWVTCEGERGEEEHVEEGRGDSQDIRHTSYKRVIPSSILEKTLRYDLPGFILWQRQRIKMEMETCFANLATRQQLLQACHCVVREVKLSLKISILPRCISVLPSSVCCVIVQTGGERGVRRSDPRLQEQPQSLLFCFPSRVRTIIFLFLPTLATIFSPPAISPFSELISGNGETILGNGDTIKCRNVVKSVRFQRELHTGSRFGTWFLTNYAR